MPRMGRVILPHYSHRIVQRGHNGKVAFVADSKCNCHAGRYPISMLGPIAPAGNRVIDQYPDRVDAIFCRT